MQTHLTDTEKSACKKTLATIAAIPGGLTKILQPLDITINYAFKCEIHKHWKEWICSGTHSFTKSGYMRKGMYEEVAEWISDSWKKMKTTVISRFSESKFITNKLFPEESDDELDDINNPNRTLDDEILNLFDSESELSSDFDGFLSAILCILNIKFQICVKFHGESLIKNK